MLEYTVHNKAELAAAVAAAAQPSYAEARTNPVKIHLGTTKYTFKEGIHEQRAAHILGRLRKMNPAFFAVAQNRSLV